MGLGNVASGDDGLGVRLAERSAERVCRGRGRRRHDARAPDRPGRAGVRPPGVPGRRRVRRHARRGVWLERRDDGRDFRRFPRTGLSLGLLARWAESAGRTASLAARSPAAVPAARRALTPAVESRWTPSCANGSARPSPAASGCRMMTPEQAVVASILLCVAGAALTLLRGAAATVAGRLAFLRRHGGRRRPVSAPSPAFFTVGPVAAAGGVLGACRIGVLPCASRGRPDSVFFC